MSKATLSNPARTTLAKIRDDIEQADGPVHDVSVAHYDLESLWELDAAGLVTINGYHGTVAPRPETDIALGEVSTAVKGYVERHEGGAVSGWCIHEDTRLRQRPVRLGLFWEDVLLRKGYTNRPRGDIASGWGVEMAGFVFPLRPSLRELLPEGTVLRVETLDGQPVPHLHDPTPIGSSDDGGEALRTKLAKGWHVDHWGAMKVPFGADDRRRGWYSGALREVIDHFSTRYGKVLFPFFGTLLGYAREGRFLDHDDDVDTAYLSRGHTLEDVAAEFRMIAADLQAAGHKVNVVATGQLNVQIKGSTLPGVDVFAAWLKPDGTFYCYPYVSGRLRSPLLFQEIELEGNRFVVPEDHTHFLEMCYGPAWRIPDPLYQMVTPPEVAAVMEALKTLR